ncbi:hypothetical protein N7535_009457 [Penicillium sp. DV-2018c]|nr:hypothetical protein N7535_009457 [Penicillium sp. DV-2018c]
MAILHNIRDVSLLGALSQASVYQQILCALLGLATYLALISSLRFQRRQAIHKKYSYYGTRQSLRTMTDQDAWSIQKTVMQTEFPYMVLKSLQFALFRTYGIPTISTLLLKTSQFSDSSTSFKRYADTGTLIGEFMAFDPRSERAQTAIARTKFLHKGYRDSGKILEADMLYTLSLFALEPIRFVKQFEWREMTEMERCAVGTYWKSLGDALDISYEALPSGKTGFEDGLHWLEEMDAWRRLYEVEYMKPHPRNKEIAAKTLDVLVYNLPNFMKPLGEYIVSYMMDDRLRTAMMPNFMRMDVFTEKPNEHGRNWVMIYEGAPYYVKPTIWNRWGLVAWFKWALGQPLPGDDGEKYYPKGYLTQDLGPKYFEGKGWKEVEFIKETLRQQRTGQCPFP